MQKRMILFIVEILLLFIFWISGNKNGLIFMVGWIIGGFIQTGACMLDDAYK